MNNEIILKPSKTRWSGLLLLSLIFVAGGALMVTHPRKESDFWIACLCIVFFGLGAIVSIIQFFPGCSFLKINIQGIQWRSLWRTYNLTWFEIEKFGVCTYTIFAKGIALERKQIGIKLSAQYSQRANYGCFATMTKYLYGYDRYLPDNYGMKYEELAALLNDKRSKYAGNG